MTQEQTLLNNYGFVFDKKCAVCVSKYHVYKHKDGYELFYRVGDGYFKILYKSRQVAFGGKNGLQYSLSKLFTQ